MRARLCCSLFSAKTGLTKDYFVLNDMVRTLMSEVPLQSIQNLLSEHLRTST